MSGWTKEFREEIYQKALAACVPKPKPAEIKTHERFVAEKQPTEAVIDAATRGNDALTKRLEETIEDRRRKQMAKEYAEHNAEGPLWRALVYWTQSAERARERIRALHGERPERGDYDPIARFEREQRGW